ncbi:MAG: hypothetical protein JO099_18015 [Acidobacteriia bacterium]|nr:hypothetical protein [Terriglobia bacterium]
MIRGALHDLIERLPDEELPIAKRFLEYLAINPAYRAALSAPPDDEPVTETDAAAIRQSQEEVRSASITPHADILREFGMR